MYWNNSTKQDKIYMFVADIAMGNYQVPRSSTSRKPDKGYDSYFAKPGISGIQNNEMIVFNNNQIKLKYILEIIV
jgi:poly [ADP-ribose] polymerase